MKTVLSLTLVLCVSLFAEGIVEDKKTGLIWQDNSYSQDVLKNYEDAELYCKSLVLDEYDRWRLPTIAELISISNREVMAPAINVGFYNTKEAFYWSSSTYLGDTTSAWGVHFYDGGVLWDSKVYRNSVRCVCSANE